MKNTQDDITNQENEDARSLEQGGGKEQSRPEEVEEKTHGAEDMRNVTYNDPALWGQLRDQQITGIITKISMEDVDV